MEYEITVLQEITFETESLQEIVTKFFTECSWHIIIKVKDKDWKIAECNLEVNDMESNIMFEYWDTSTEWYTWWDYYDVLAWIQDAWLDINSLTLI